MVLSLKPLAKKQARINERLFEYWSDIKGEQKFPQEKDVKPEDISDIWDACFLVSIVPEETPRFKYSYLGQNIIEAYGAEGDSKSVCEELIYPAPAPLTEKFEVIEQSGEYQNEENEFTNARGLLIKYRSVMLPLASPDGSVGFILGGMKWKAL